MLFAMFVNDISSIVLRPVFMFGDNTKIFCATRSTDDYKAL